MTQPDERAWIAFGAVATQAPVTARRLLDETGGPQAALAANPAAWRAAGATENTLRALGAPDREFCARAEAWLARADHHLLHWHSDDYPAALRRVDDAPLILFAIGDRDLLGMPALAVVGSRNPTPGGRDNAQAFARHLAGRGLAIVSGLAAGIDAAAHEGALAADGATVAVLGCGIDACYPAGNRALYEQIGSAGLVLSEYGPGLPPRAWQFPARNRIIAGLALGTLVVEAARRSGSLITARLAGEQGRSVFAIPGSIHNPLARGCHQLIRQGARLVEQASDIFEELGPALTEALQAPLDAAAGAGPRAPEPQADPAYAQLLELLGWDPVSLDTLAARSPLTTAELSSMLLIMELDGLVEKVPGGGFMRSKPR